MKVHRTAENYMADKAFTSAFGNKRVYTPEGVANRHGVAKDPSVSIPSVRIPIGQIGEVGDVVADIPTALAVSTVNPVTLNPMQTEATRSDLIAKTKAQSQLQAYINKLSVK